MKRIRIEELLAEVKANIVPFFSVCMFVCLGIGLFLGIQWGSVAMSRAVEEVFESGSMHDIEVQFPYGLTRDDLDQLAAIDGVSAVEAGYVSYQTMLDGDARYVLKFQGLTESLDQPINVVGTLPAKPNEVALLGFWAEEHGVEVGDTVVLKHDAKETAGDDDQADADGMAYLNADRFVVTALVEHPSYLSTVTGSLGVASIGTGSIDCVAFVTADAFDADAFEDGYPVAYLRCDGLRDANTFAAGYQQASNAIVQQVSELGGKLGSNRYHALRDEAQGKVDDATEQISDAEGQLADAEDQISDGARQIAEGEQELADAQVQLADGREQLSDAESQLVSGQQQIDDARFAAQTEREKAEAQLADARAQLDEAQAAYDEKEAEYNEAKGKYDEAVTRFDTVSGNYDQLLEDYEALHEQSERNEPNESEMALDQAISDYTNDKAALDSFIEEAEAAGDKGTGDEGTDGDAADAEGSAADAEGSAADAEGAEGNAADAEGNAADAEGSAADAEGVEGNAADAEDNAADAEGAEGEEGEEEIDYDQLIAEFTDRVEEDSKAIDTAYAAFAKEYGDGKSHYESFMDNARIVAAAYDIDLDEALKAIAEAQGVEYNDEPLPELIEPNAERTNLEEVLDRAEKATSDLNQRRYYVETVMQYEVEVGGKYYKLTELRQGIADAGKALDDAKAELDAAKAELDAGWAAYYAASDELDRKVAEGNAQIDAAQAQLDASWDEYYAARATYEQKLAEYESGQVDLAQAKVDLEKARTELQEKRAELEDAKVKLAEARESLDDMREYEWLVFPRLENGGAQSIDTITTMMGNVRWAMALLFVLVGLFVCYSAVSRLVNDQIRQVGTKKALGFREGEVSALYLSFSGLAVLVGTFLAGFVAVFVVEGIMNPASADPFTLPSFPPYFSLPELLVGGGIEMALILLSTWLATHGLLRRNAVELLNGGQTASAKEHFWERTKLWKGMSLFSQTVVNNCVNDTRRVLATLIGVAGCTALIVCAVTLSMNVSQSIKRHYEAIYDFDTLVYLDTDVDGADEAVGAKLDELGLSSAPVHVETLQVRQPNGYRSSTTLFVPTDEAAFAERYHLLPSAGGEADLAEDGIWVSAAYADHMGVGVGDTITVTEGTGQTHEFVVAGVFEYHVLRTEFVLSRAEYRTSFGAEPEANVLMVERGDMDVDSLRGALASTDGYDALKDDYADTHYAFDELANLLNTVVLVYLLLSALMAIVVLLNLDIMFVDEKKRELIVLMINGFSVGDAKAYIYRDSIALTVVGIIVGVIFGAVMGGITVRALEPSYGSFISSFNPVAALVGIVGASVFSAAVLLYALRRIPRFDLTDINRF